MFGNPSSKIKVGVVGVGVLGRYHTKIYSESANAELVGVYDVNPKAAEAVAKELAQRRSPRSGNSQNSARLSASPFPQPDTMPPRWNLWQ